MKPKIIPAGGSGFLGSVLAAGFAFRHPDLAAAIKHLVGHELRLVGS
jgi:hypothetical protein